jgi:hypothetical protein
LLVRLIPIGKHEELRRGLSIDLLGEAGRRLHLLIGSGGTVPLIVETVSVVIGHAFPVDELAVRWDGREIKPITWDDPASMLAAIRAATRTMLTVPTTSVMTVSMIAAAAMKTYAVTGVAIAAIRTMCDGES